MSWPTSADIFAAVFSWKATFVYGYLAWALFVHYRGNDAQSAMYREVVGPHETIGPFTSTCVSTGANHASMMRAAHVCKLHLAIARLETTFGER